MTEQTVHSIDVLAPIVGNIWQIHHEVGDRVEEGEVLMILESMKMEIPIAAPSSGIVSAITIELNQIVQEGDCLATLMER